MTGQMVKLPEDEDTPEKVRGRQESPSFLALLSLPSLLADTTSYFCSAWTRSSA